MIFEAHDADITSFFEQDISEARVNSEVSQERATNSIVFTYGLIASLFLSFMVYQLLVRFLGEKHGFGGKINAQASTFGIMVAVAGAVYSLIECTYWTQYKQNPDETEKWIASNEAAYNWVRWSSLAASLLLHWLFNMRYIYASIQMPLLEQNTSIYCDLIEKALGASNPESVVSLRNTEINEHEAMMVDLEVR